MLISPLRNAFSTPEGAVLINCLTLVTLAADTPAAAAISDPRPPAVQLPSILTRPSPGRRPVGWLVLSPLARAQDRAPRVSDSSHSVPRIGGAFGVANEERRPRSCRMQYIAVWVDPA